MGSLLVAETTFQTAQRRLNKTMVGKRKRTKKNQLHRTTGAQTMATAGIQVAEVEVTDLKEEAEVTDTKAVAGAVVEVEEEVRLPITS